MGFLGEFPQPTPARAAIEAAATADEERCVEALLAEVGLGEAARARIGEHAAHLVEVIREQATDTGGIDAFMGEYDLSSREGVMLMCLAEALLRVPDGRTADRLIADKIGGADWERHLGHSDSPFVNASTWALMLTGRLIRLEKQDLRDPASALKRLVGRSGEPVIRRAMVQAMRIMGRQFVMGRTIEEALGRARDDEKRGYLHSFDMLGESAVTAADAERYWRAYSHAIEEVGKANAGRGPMAGPGISIKLSALHPRFQTAKRERILEELVPRVADLALKAKHQDIGLCIDTEEADRLEITLDVFEAVMRLSDLFGWEGFGLAIQAYQKRARPLIDWLSEVARRHQRRLSVRLVKGAYWDAEIKRAQVEGLAGYPVFTRKMNTDVSYIACAKRLLAEPVAFYPQFATHNAHTLACILEMAQHRTDLEFQRLHGMGEPLFDQIVGAKGPGIPVRIYAPVGSHEALLAYLVRRLLENGSNTSFVNRIVDMQLPVDEVVADPVAQVAKLKIKAHPRISRPTDLFGGERQLAKGIDLAEPQALRALDRAMADAEVTAAATPLVGGEMMEGGEDRPVISPADHQRIVGMVRETSAAAAERAVATAVAAQPGWDATPADERAACLERAADLMEREMPALMAVCVREAGKTIPDALAEVREAVDFCRYYAARARAEFARPLVLPGPAGEANSLALRGRGAFVCISPWNFPLAIFCGQAAAALAAGNAVVAKPAEQTPLIAARAVSLLHEAGIPLEALNFLPGDGETGARLVGDPRIAGVAFTGSVETARAINRALAGRSGPIVPLIAETGGQNTMIVDSTALPEQVATDAVTSAFRSAGQRCSALRVLFVQKDIAPRVTDLLVGAMEELEVGDPARLATDVGPVIDTDALAMLRTHADRMKRDATRLGRASLSEACAGGTFFAPAAYRIHSLAMMEKEIFGPILHVVEYGDDHLDSVIEAINATGYGLTIGIHSRVDAFADYVHKRVRAGNAYVNNPMIGAVVGVQPFGGEGLSGTGPKAGGPRYLHRFAVERTLTVNTAAAGGDAALLSLEDDAADTGPS